MNRPQQKSVTSSHDEHRRPSLTPGATRRRSSVRTMNMRELQSSFNSLDEHSVHNLNSAVTKKSDRALRWKRNSSLVSEKRISFMRKSMVDDMFYTEEEIADFKYEKFMEECGLDPSEFE